MKTPEEIKARLVTLHETGEFDEVLSSMGDLVHNEDDKAKISVRWNDENQQPDLVLVVKGPLGTATLVLEGNLEAVGEVSE